MDLVGFESQGGDLAGMIDLVRPGVGTARAWGRAPPGSPDAPRPTELARHETTRAGSCAGIPHAGLNTKWPSALSGVRAALNTKGASIWGHEGAVRPTGSPDQPSVSQRERRGAMERRRKKAMRPLGPDARARAEVHLSLAEALACEQFRVCDRVVPLEELLGEARLALACAASRYDETKAVPFGTYVTFVVRCWLDQAVTVWCRGGSPGHGDFTDLDREGEEGLLPADFPCARTRDPARVVADRELVDRVRRAMPTRWFTLLQLYYVEEHTLDEIGGKIGISGERVRTLLAEAVRRARRHLPKEERGTARRPAVLGDGGQVPPHPRRARSA